MPNPYNSRQWLVHRYPGVEFQGVDTDATTDIGVSVSIAPGAVVDISGGPRIIGKCTIGGSVIIRGGIIKDSSIDGHIDITGGNIVGCDIRGGKVEGGTLRNFIQMGGIVRTGDLHGGFMLGGEIMGGRLSDCKILHGACVPENAPYLEKKIIGPGYDFRSTLGVRPTRMQTPRTTLTGTSTPPRTDELSSGSSLTGIVHLTRYNQEPPDDLLDPILRSLIDKAVITPQGHTYDEQSITRWIMEMKGSLLPTAREAGTFYSSRNCHALEKRLLEIRKPTRIYRVSFVNETSNISEQSCI